MPFKPTLTTTCAFCQSVFLAARPARGYKPRKYCSQRCANSANVRILDEAAFLTHVNKTSTCWLWMASKTKAGYGLPTHQGRRILAHRFSWILRYGPIPQGMEVCHRCDNPPCVNPEHLFLGSHGDNIRDSWAKGRSNATHRNRGIAHHATTLTDADIMNIRRRGLDGERHRAIADSYGMSRPGVTAIISRRTWKHLT